MSGFSGPDLLALFHLELEAHVPVLAEGLVDAESRGGSGETIEPLMRAAHSLKGAAKIVGLEPLVGLSHAMEELLVAAQRGEAPLTGDDVDTLLGATDLFDQLRQVDPVTLAEAVDARVAAIEGWVAKLAGGSGLDASEGQPRRTAPRPAASHASPRHAKAPHATPRRTNLPASTTAAPEANRVLRLSEEALNRLLGLASEALVESRRLKPFAERLQRLKRQQARMHASLDAMSVRDGHGHGHDVESLRRASTRLTGDMAALLDDVNGFDHRLGRLSRGLYGEVLRTHMRPFADVLGGLPRLVRDVGRGLGKSAVLQVRGESTQVDRTILDLLQAPLSHLLRNAVDHGLEAPDVRLAAGKPEAGTVVLEAQHHNGMLVVSVTDDGAGIDLASVRERIIAKDLASEEMVGSMSEAEVLSFLCLPDFSMRDEVTEISGRGVGLDAVTTMVQLVGGDLRVVRPAGAGTRFELVLPLTLSVIRVLLVEVAGASFAISLARIERALRVDATEVTVVEGRSCVEVDGEVVGLVSGAQALELDAPPPADGALSILVLGTDALRFGVVVDRFVGEREVVVQRLDPRLGKLRNISAGAVLDDGHAALILDVDDFLRSVDRLVAGGRVGTLSDKSRRGGEARETRVLIVDDSITVRETERQLLASHGYDVSVAVDGVDGWNSLRARPFDIVITDVDMPRMDGLRLTELIKKDPRHAATPVVIVSYKDRAEDRDRGLAAGADAYLTKSSFHDETLLRAVANLVGKAA